MDWRGRANGVSDGDGGGSASGSSDQEFESRLDALYERLLADGRMDALRFEPMLPRVYELTLPSIDSRLNFISVGRRHAAFLRHFYGECSECDHATVLNEKMKLFTAVITKLLDVNGILERRDVSD